MNFPDTNEGTYGGQVGQLDNHPEDSAVFSVWDYHYGVVPEPRPSSEAIPEWAEDGVDNGIQNALDEGWLIRSPASVRFNSVDGDEPVEWHDNFDMETIGIHYPDQMPTVPIPFNLIKFHSWWTLHLPDGYSALLTAPLGRMNTVFSPFSGVVDFDNFPTVTHIPTMWEDSVKLTIPEGTPIGQIIPFKRDDMITSSTVRDATPEELEELKNETESDKIDDHTEIRRDV